MSDDRSQLVKEILRIRAGHRALRVDSVAGFLNSVGYARETAFRAEGVRSAVGFWGLEASAAIEEAENAIQTMRAEIKDRFEVLNRAVISPDALSAAFIDDIRQMKEQIEGAVSSIHGAVIRSRHAAETVPLAVGNIRKAISDVVEYSKTASSSHNGLALTAQDANTLFVNSAIDIATDLPDLPDTNLESALLTEIRRVGWTTEQRQDFEQIKNREESYRSTFEGVVTDSQRITEGPPDVGLQAAQVAEELQQAEFALQAQIRELESARELTSHYSTDPAEVAGRVTAAVTSARSILANLHVDFNGSQQFKGWLNTASEFASEAAKEADSIAGISVEANLARLIEQQKLLAKIELAQTLLSLDAEADLANYPEIQARFGEPPQDQVMRDDWRLGVGKTMFLAKVFGYGKESLFASNSSSLDGPQKEFVEEQKAAIGASREQLGLPMIDIFPAQARNASGPTLAS